MIGALGDIRFEVSQRQLLTLNNLKENGSSTWAKHQRHANNTLIEFVANDPQTITFDMILAQQLGVSVESTLGMIRTYEYAGSNMKLVIGGAVYGRYRWVIQKHSVSYEAFGKDNSPILAKVNISLLEYVKWS